MLEKDYRQLVDLYENLEIKQDPVVDPTVLEIIGTWIDLLSNYPEEVLALDLVSLHDYMSERAELLHQRHADKVKTTRIKILLDANYLYKLSSVILEKESLRIYYPYSLVVASNYTKAIRSFCTAFKETNFSLISLVEVLDDVLRSGYPFLFDDDIKLVAELLSLDIQGQESISSILDEKVRTKESIRLNILQVLQLNYAVNFPALGLIPYMQLSSPTEQLPESHRQFIEYEYLIPAPFRILLLPIDREKTLLEDFDHSQTTQILDWYYSYNLQYLERSITGYWKWPRDLSIMSRQPSTAIFKLLDYTVPVTSLSTTQMTILELIHRYVTIPPAEIATVTGISKRTVYDNFKRAVEMGVIIPYWGFDRIGLSEYFRVILASEPFDSDIRTYIASFPKTSTIRGSKFNSAMLFLPPRTGKKVEKYLITAEQDRKCNILAIGMFTASSRTINRGFSLHRYLKEKKEKERERKTVR